MSLPASTSSSSSFRGSESLAMTTSMKLLTCWLTGSSIAISTTFCTSIHSTICDSTWIYRLLKSARRGLYDRLYSLILLFGKCSSLNSSSVQILSISFSSSARFGCSNLFPNSYICSGLMLRSLDTSATSLLLMVCNHRFVNSCSSWLGSALVAHSSDSLVPSLS